MQGPRRTFTLPAFGLALAGLVAGHLLSYALAISDEHQRAFVLRSTGHDYLPAAGEIALVLAVAAIVGVIAGSIGRRTTAPARPLVARLIALQVGAFLAVEVLERLVAEAPLAGLGHDHLLVVGVAVQIGVALLGIGLLRALTRAGSSLAAAFAVAPVLRRPRLAFDLPSISTRPPVLVLAGAAGVRGPPAPSNLPR